MRSQSVLGAEREFTTTSTILLEGAEADLAAERRARAERLQRLQHAAHADVVGHAAVDEVDVRAVLAVLERLHLAVALQCARRRPDASVGLGDVA